MKNYLFKIKGIVNNKEQVVEYYFDPILKQGRVSGDEMICFIFEGAMKSSKSTGPVAQYMDRDINNPLAVLFVLIEDCFDKIIETDGDLPTADAIPNDAIS